MSNYLIHDNENDSPLVSVTVEEMIKGLNHLDLMTFKIIASKGISEEKEVIQTVIDDLIDEEHICHSKDSVWRSIKILIIANLLKSQSIHTGYRRLNILSLTPGGETVYMKLYRKTPAKSELDRMIANHNSVLHGYMIKDVKTILQNKFGLTRISTDRKENTVSLPNGGSCIPDVIAWGSAQPTFFEVECGNHNQEDFDGKCDRLKQISKKIYFIVRSRSDAKDKLLPQIERWVQKRRDILVMNGVKVYLTTLRDLSNHLITYIIDPALDEPICRISKRRKEESDNV